MSHTLMHAISRQTEEALGIAVTSHRLWWSLFGNIPVGVHLFKVREITSEIRVNGRCFDIILWALNRCQRRFKLLTS